MNDKDAFEKWWKSLKQPFGGCRKGYKKGAKDGWQAACEYKQKEIDELEKEKDYLYKKMENMRDIYKHSERFQAENAQLRDEISELNKKLSSVWKEAEEFYLDD